MNFLSLLLVASALSAGEFDKHWTIESESPDYTTQFLGDTVEIAAPQGITVWYNQKIEAPVVIEYDARLMVDEKRLPQEGDKPGTLRDRPSDLNCFVMASDPLHPKNIFERKDWRSGIFVHSYSLQLYYVGYGGNGNKTTRFRRYDGREAGVTDKDQRPAILTEYTDVPHLNVPNRWRHVRIIVAEGKFIYEIDGERLVSYDDPQPLKSGWFGFRSTWSRFQLANFRYHRYDPSIDNAVELRWLGEDHNSSPFTLHPSPFTRIPVHFGVPYPQGMVASDAAFTLSGEPVDFRPLAYWPDGSVKWAGFEGAVTPKESYSLKPMKAPRQPRSPGRDSRKKGDKVSTRPVISLSQTAQQYVLDNGCYRLYLPKAPETTFIDSMVINRCVMRGASLVSRLTDEAEERTCLLDSLRLLRQGDNAATFKVYGHLAGAKTSSFVLHLYAVAGAPQIRMVHTFIYNIGQVESAPFGTANQDPMLRSLGVRFRVPLRDEAYNRHVYFATSDTALWHESVENLSARKLFSDPSFYVSQRQGEKIDSSAFNPSDRHMIDHLATWDGFRLSQLSDMGWTLRKRAKANTPWIGTFAGHRAGGAFALADSEGGLAVALKDFWQSYPSTLQIDGATSAEASMTVYLWSPEAEPMDLRHYDTEPHDLIASYEDVQEGMSSPFGIARTSELMFSAVASSQDLPSSLFLLPSSLSNQLACTPQYLHAQRAFGVWSLPTSDPLEEELRYWCDFCRREQDERHWYGYWNYGDFMHAYDPYRQEWKYDVGGFAWDNTELASPMFLWYNFLRTGDRELWDMAVAMTRHASEVDVYHDGPWNALGSRHNVTHWGCGAKESRISEAQWNRFFYYLSGGDDRTGDLMTAVRDADTLLYRLDPMRLAQPRELYPCTAPARLRIGPDWVGYVSNWMTEYERTLNPKYLDKILAGMNSINQLPHGIFTGPKALGYDPATGVISWEGDTAQMNTNHLLSIMGGFELMNELLPTLMAGSKVQGSVGPSSFLHHTSSIISEFQQTWTKHCRDYRHNALTISRNNFLIPRLPAYSFSMTGDAASHEDAWKQLMRERQTPERFSTNGISCFGLDAIYMLEACPR